MQISVTKANETVSARLQGVLDISDVGPAKERLMQILEAGRDIRIDFSSLTEIDTAGIQLVLAVHIQSQRQAKSCRFLHPTAEVLQAFASLSLDGIFDQSVATT